MNAPDPEVPKKRSPVRRAARWVGILVLAFVLVVGTYAGVLRLTGNVHTVVVGQLYRSGQLDSAQFVKVIDKDGIKSILNLRGPAPRARWYQHEIGVSKAMGVTHYDFGMSANHFVPRARIDSIVAILRSAPKPILIHCEGGADRSGLVAAIYERVIRGESKKAADGQLTFRYGHLPGLFNHTYEMDRSYWAYVDSAATSPQH